MAFCSVVSSASDGSAGAGANAWARRSRSSSSPGTAGHLLIEQHTQTRECPRLRHADGSGPLPEHRCDFVSRQAGDYPELEQLLVARIETPEGGAHGRHLFALQHVIERIVAGAGVGGRHGLTTARDALGVEHDMAQDPEEPRVESAAGPREPVDLADRSHHRLAHCVSCLIHIEQPSPGVGEQAGVDAPVQLFPGALVPEPSPFDERTDVVLLVHITYVSVLGGNCHAECPDSVEAVSSDPQRRQALLGVKLSALVRDHWGEAARTPSPFPGGAALNDDGTGWVLVDEEPARALGGALGWARRHQIRQLHVLVEDDVAADLARRARAVAAQPKIWRGTGRSVPAAEPAPLESSAPSLDGLATLMAAIEAGGA